MSTGSELPLPSFRYIASVPYQGPKRHERTSGTLGWRDVSNDTSGGPPSNYMAVSGARVTTLSRDGFRG